MGSKESSGISFIRDVFKRSKAGQGTTTRELVNSASRYSMSGASLSAMEGNDVANLLELDTRILSRYGDYTDMDTYSEISSALDIYSDDATQVDSTTGKTVWVDSADENVKNELNDMLYKRIDIDNQIWPMARSLAKMGNDFEEIILGDDNAGVIGISYLPSPTMRRVEDDKGDILGFVQTLSDSMDITPDQYKRFKVDGGRSVNDQKNMAVFEDWRVVHMRLTSKYRESMYGWSVIDAARWVWKRLMLLEDAVMVYKLTRSPSRYAFYIDVGRAPKHESERLMQEAMQSLKKKAFVNPKTGKMDLRYNPLAMDQDFFLAMREGREVARVEALNGPSYQQVDDVQYFLFKLYAALKIPRAYMGYDENMPSKATLSQEDVRFCRTILRLQREIRNGLKKICMINLAAKRIDPMAVAYDVKMTVPSSIFELGQLEARRARADLASLMQSHVSLNWLLKNVYGFSDSEVEEMAKDRKKEGAEAAALQAQVGDSGLPQGESVGHARGRRRIVRPVRLGGISERELFEGKREDEKRIHEVVSKMFSDPGSPIGRHFGQVNVFLREILDTVRRSA